MTTVTPKIVFNALYEDNIKNVIFDEMDGRLDCNRRFGVQTRWFKEYPEFTLRSAYGSDKQNSVAVNPSFGPAFDMSISDINALYRKIKALFPNGQYINHYNNTIDITIHEIFSLGDNLWATRDLQGVFHAPTPVLPEEYQEWCDLAKLFDYTYMYSDSAHAYNAGRDYEKRMDEARKGLDEKLCSLWYNYVLRRARRRVGDSNFGMKTDLYTYDDFLDTFQVQPTATLPLPPTDEPINKPCRGFPWHEKRIGTFEGDM